MAPAGYSGTPLYKKLGVSAGTQLLLIDAPDDYFDLLQADFNPKVVKSGNLATLVHLFVTKAAELESRFLQLIAQVRPDTVIWVSWYKKSAKMDTDITEDRIRAIVLPTGWVDVKVCAVSAQWSGLKIVQRKANR
jgi:hypothetical protein